VKELSEEEKYIRKAALLKKALADADKMDAAYHSGGRASVLLYLRKTMDLIILS